MTEVKRLETRAGPSITEGNSEWLSQKRETSNQSLTGLPEECQMKICVQTLMPFESRDVALGQHALILFRKTENGKGR